MSKQPSFDDQAAVLRNIVRLCQTSDGSLASNTYVNISAADAEVIRGVASRMSRMAPHEDSIRKLVTGK